MKRILPWLAAGLVILSCDLPPGFNEVEPDEANRRPVDTADIAPLPGNQELWSTDFVGWQFGGNLRCGAAPGLPGGAGGAGGVGGVGGTPRPLQPTIVQIWDGITDPCTQFPQEGDRVLQIELSDIAAGTYQVGIQCLGPLTATVILAEVRGGSLLTRVALQGTVTILGLAGLLEPGANEVLEGAFTVSFGEPQINSVLGNVTTGGLPRGGIALPPGQVPGTTGGGFTSGGFRTISRCF